MRTTIDVPEDVLHRAKIVAAQRKTTLKELVLQGLDYALNTPAPDPERERHARANALVAALQARNTSPMQPLSREQAHRRAGP